MRRLRCLLAFIGSADPRAVNGTGVIMVAAAAGFITCAAIGLVWPTLVLMAAFMVALILLALRV